MVYVLFTLPVYALPFFVAVTVWPAPLNRYQFD